MTVDDGAYPNSEDCEQWDADGLSIKDVELQHGEDAAVEYQHWIYLNNK